MRNNTRQHKQSPPSNLTICKTLNHKSKMPFIYLYIAPKASV
jgi:hypothetical protein